MPIVNYRAHAFNNRLGVNATQQINVSWPQIVHAAITVGRRGWSDVLKNGRHSLFEMYYRASMVYANLQTSCSDRIIKTGAYKGLDPSEKSAISYFLGLTFTKLIAGRIFGIHWLMHLDVYSHLLQVLIGGGRPDLVGQDRSGRWCVFEAKGRSNGMDRKVIAKAKAQTQGLRTICSRTPVLRVASITYFSGQSLRLHLEDPDEIDKDAVDLDIPEDQFQQDYYRPFMALIDEQRGAGRGATIDQRMITVEVASIERRIHVVDLEDSDLEIGLEEQVHETLRSQDIRSRIIRIMPSTPEPLKRLDTVASQWRNTLPDEPMAKGEDDSFLGPDGIFVRLRRSWSTNTMRLDPQERRG